MNRAQRRKLSKNKNLYNKVLNNLKKISDEYEDKKDEFFLNDGEKVKIDVDKILSRKVELNSKYLNFITENKNNIMTVKNVNNVVHDIVTLEENELWMFHISELIKVEDE